MSINQHDADGISFKFPYRAHIIDLTGQLKSLSVGGENLYLLSGVREDKAQPPPPELLGYQIIQVNIPMRKARSTRDQHQLLVRAQMHLSV